MRFSLRLSTEARLLNAFGNIESDYASLRKTETQEKTEAPRLKERRDKERMTPEGVEKSVEARMEEREKTQDKLRKTVEDADKRTKSIEDQAKQNQDQLKKGQDKQNAELVSRIDKGVTAARRDNKADRQAKLNTEDYSINAAMPVTFFTEQNGEHTQAQDQAEQKQKTAKVETAQVAASAAPAVPEKKQAEDKKQNAEQVAKDEKQSKDKKQEVAKATGVNEQQNAKSA
jgi:hypothetical protein